MTWDKNKIENLLTKINYRMNNVESKKELSILMFDYFSLIEILKTFSVYEYQDIIANHNLKNLKFSDLKDYYEEFYKDSFNCLKNNRDCIFNVSRFVETTKLSSPKLTLNKRIGENIYLDMIGEFFYQFDKEHYNIFKELVDGNIHFAKNDSEVGNRAKGKCYHLLSTEETFIITNFKDRKNVAVLPHEIAHAYELSQLKNIINRSSWHFSTFTESYPKFMELAFLDYFLNSEYSSYFLKLKYYILDSLNLSADYALSYFFNLNSGNEFEFVNIPKELKLTKKYIDYVISDLFAIYLFNLYKNDKEQFNNVIRKFHSYKGKSDELIWNLISDEKLIEAYKSEINSYYNEVTLSRLK